VHKVGLVEGSEEIPAVYNTKKVKEIIEREGFENAAKWILEKLGFSGIDKAVYGSGYDLIAKKDNKDYAIEVKGTKTGEDVVIRWHQLEKMWDDYVDASRIPLLIFINAEGVWFLYGLEDGFS
jgi:Holliday junction resolvase